MARWIKWKGKEYLELSDDFGTDFLFTPKEVEEAAKRNDAWISDLRSGKAKLRTRQPWNEEYK